MSRMKQKEAQRTETKRRAGQKGSPVSQREAEWTPKKRQVDQKESPEDQKKGTRKSLKSAQI